MSSYLITSNQGKFAEMHAMLPDLEQLDINLPEIQEIDPRMVIRAKLNEAAQHTTGEFLVEDTSLSLVCLGGLPGPLMKWFLKTIGNEGLVRLADCFGQRQAYAYSMIGYWRSLEEIYFFEGIITGRIVSPRGSFGFDWDPIFQPDGYTKTFAEMNMEEKNAVSMRRIAVDKLLEFWREQK